MTSASLQIQKFMHIPVVGCWGDLSWHGIHTKFHENEEIHSKIKMWKTKRVVVSLT